MAIDPRETKISLKDLRDLKELEFARDSREAGYEADSFPFTPENKDLFVEVKFDKKTIISPDGQEVEVIDDQFLLFDFNPRYRPSVLSGQNTFTDITEWSHHGYFQQSDARFDRLTGLGEWDPNSDYKQAWLQACETNDGECEKTKLSTVVPEEQDPYVEELIRYLTPEEVEAHSHDLSPEYALGILHPETQYGGQHTSFLDYTQLLFSSDSSTTRMNLHDFFTDASDASSIHFTDDPEDRLFNYENHIRLRFYVLRLASLEVGQDLSKDEHIEFFETLKAFVEEFDYNTLDDGLPHYFTYKALFYLQEVGVIDVFEFKPEIDEVVAADSDTPAIADADLEAMRLDAWDILDFGYLSSREALELARRFPSEQAQPLEELDYDPIFGITWFGSRSIFDSDIDVTSNSPGDLDDLDDIDFDFLFDSDIDADGVNNTHDLCPDEAEDLDGFEDEDGCADHDNDSDGIADLVDKCPDEFGKGTGANLGCPVILTGEPTERITLGPEANEIGWRFLQKLRAAQNDDIQLSTATESIEMTEEDHQNSVELQNALNRVRTEAEFENEDPLTVSFTDEDGDVIIANSPYPADHAYIIFPPTLTIGDQSFDRKTQPDQADAQFPYYFSNVAMLEYIIDNPLEIAKYYGKDALMAYWFSEDNQIDTYPLFKEMLKNFPHEVKEVEFWKKTLEARVTYYDSPYPAAKETEGWLIKELYDCFAHVTLTSKKLPKGYLPSEYWNEFIATSYPDYHIDQLINSNDRLYFTQHRIQTWMTSHFLGREAAALGHETIPVAADLYYAYAINNPMLFSQALQKLNDDYLVPELGIGLHCERVGQHYQCVWVKITRTEDHEVESEDGTKTVRVYFVKSIAESSKAADGTPKVVSLSHVSGNFFENYEENPETFMGPKIFERSVNKTARSYKATKEAYQAGEIDHPFATLLDKSTLDSFEDYQAMIEHTTVVHELAHTEESLKGYKGSEIYSAICELLESDDPFATLYNYVAFCFGYNTDTEQYFLTQRDGTIDNKPVKIPAVLTDHGKGAAHLLTVLARRKKWLDEDQYFHNLTSEELQELMSKILEELSKWDEDDLMATTRRLKKNYF